MYHKERLSVIVRMLVLPFCEPLFLSEDFLEEEAKLYGDIKDLVSRSAIKQYSKVRQKIEFFFSQDAHQKNIDDALLLLESFYPQKKMASYLLFGETIDWYYFDELERLSECFVTLRDGVLSFQELESKKTILKKEDGFCRIEIWQTLSRLMMPDILMAIGLERYPTMTMERLNEVKGWLDLSDRPLRKLLEQGVAETHLHFSAGALYGRTWEHVMNFYYWSQDLSSFCDWYGKEYYVISLYRFMFAEYLEFLEKKNRYLSFHNYLKYEYFNDCGKRWDDVLDVFQSIDAWDFKKVKTNRFLSEKLIKKYSKHGLMDKHKPVLSESCYRNYIGEPEIIFLFQSVRFFKKYRQGSKEITKEVDYLLHLFMQYIRSKNIFFDDKVQDNKLRGLEYFTGFFNRSTDSLEFKPHNLSTENFEKSILNWNQIVLMDQFKSNYLKKIEVKVSPQWPKLLPNKSVRDSDLKYYKQRILSKIEPVFKSYQECINATKEMKSDKNIPHLGIVYHLIKTNSPDNFLDKTCPLYGSHVRKNERNDYGAMQLKGIRFIDALMSLLEEYPLLADYIVGIDAAARENETPPWVYAPAFKRVHRDENMEGTRQGIGFTYHVGEDFRHIVSGLRHIDEVLVHYHYRSGDRLGHAIALGVDIEAWMHSNKMVCTTVGEYLQDLLWLWGLENKEDWSSGYLNLEFKIMKIAHKLFPFLNILTPYPLWQAYQNSFEEWDDFEECAIYNMSSHVSGIELNNILVQCLYHCPYFQEKLSEPIYVKIEKSDLEIFKSVQEKIIHKVELMGVFIEINPTSNTAIGEVDGLLSHPGLNLNNKIFGIEESKNHTVMLTINSDDPLIFNTNVETEIAYIYYALIERGFSRENVLKWIDQMRQYGMDCTFIRKTKTIDEITNDLDRLLSDVF